MAEGSSGLVTILFTDLVGSTELLARAGDEEAQRIFRAHHDLLAETAGAHGGKEVKWLGDGLMVAFPSAADAVRAAIAMQQAARRPIQAERLAIRVGLNAGEALRDATDYFGLPVVVARRLCDRAAAGQILCANVVAELLAGRPDFAFADLGKVELKGVPQAVAAFEVRYERGPITGVLDRMPFVGRVAELGRLSARLAEAVAGRGGLALVAGEPGIGKTRLVEELAERAGRAGARVLWGSCFEGGWAPPYLPFTEAVEALALAADPEELRADLGSGGPPVAQLVPALRKVLPDLPQPVSLQPDEERFRLLDAVTQLFVARCERAPLVVVVDDLHWADRGTVAMLRHLARFASRHRILLLGTYRDAEVDEVHPLAQALGALPRETSYEAIQLGGLDVEGVTQLLALAAEHEVSDKVGAAWAKETEGNPFFVKELLRHLIDEGKLYRDPDGRWVTTAPLRDLGIPTSVREVVGRRLVRLAEPAQRLLGVAAAFEGAFRFDVAAAVADLPEGEALDALDEALAAQLVQHAGDDTCAFTHALVRHTIYSELSPPRRLRLHRRVAEALEAAYGTKPSPAQAGEIASQYHRSAALPGSERGVEPALSAATHAEATGAHDEAAGFLRLALDLCPNDDRRRLRILSRLGIALTWALHIDEAVAVAGEAAEALAAAEGPDPAADYLSEVAYACNMAGSPAHAWELAPTGLNYAGAKRDVAWARLVMIDHQRREAQDPDYPGIPLDTPERAEAAAILRAARLDPMGPAPMEAVFSSRDEALSSVIIAVRGYWYGDYAGAVPLLRAEAEKSLAKGQLARAARAQCFVATNYAALGRFDEMRDSMEQAEALEARLGIRVASILQAKEMIATATDEGLEEIAAAVAPLTTRVIPALAWLQGGFYAWSARIAARLGHADEALRCLGLLVPWLERAPAWTIGMPMMACHAAETLWVLERLDHLDVIEAALQDKVVAPDFRNPTVDGRLALARLCALTGRHEQALSWFARAREVLTEQGALTVLATADYDEALMYLRRGAPGGLDRARPLLDAARHQFEEIGMTGWLRRAEELNRRLG